MKLFLQPLDSEVRSEMDDESKQPVWLLLNTFSLEN